MNLDYTKNELSNYLYVLTGEAVWNRATDHRLFAFISNIIISDFLTKLNNENLDYQIYDAHISLYKTIYIKEQDIFNHIMSKKRNDKINKILDETI